MLAAVLDHMADILHAAGVTPGGDLLTEILPYEFRQAVHIKGMDTGGSVTFILHKKARQRTGPAGPEGFG